MYVAPAIFTQKLLHNLNHGKSGPQNMGYLYSFQLAEQSKSSPNGRKFAELVTLLCTRTVDNSRTKLQEIKELGDLFSVTR
jgi:hypothetical protein